MWPIRTILHPTDFSAQSEAALRVACAFASDYRAHLVILHVIRVPVVVPDGVMVSNINDGRDQLHQQLNNLELPEDQIGVINRLEEGNPAVEILQLARLCHADLIVMGSHGRRGLKRFFMGSVTEEVVRKASCPVLSVGNPPAATGAPAPNSDRTICVSSRTLNP